MKRWAIIEAYEGFDPKDPLKLDPSGEAPFLALYWSRLSAWTNGWNHHPINAMRFRTKKEAQDYMLLVIADAMARPSKAQGKIRVYKVPLKVLAL